MTASSRPMVLRCGGPTTISKLQERCEAARSAGFDGIEICLENIDPFFFNPTAPPRDARGWLPALKRDPATDLHIVCVAARLSSTQLDCAVEELTALIASARDLSAGCAAVRLPPVGSADGTNGFRRYQDALNFAYDLLRRTHLDIEAAGVMIGLEAADGGFLLSPVETRELVDAINSWAVGACVDARRIIALGAVGDWLETLGRRVKALRLYENTDIKPEALAAIDLETPVVVAGTRSPEILRKHLQGLDCARRGTMTQ